MANESLAEYTASGRSARKKLYVGALFLIGIVTVFAAMVFAWAALGDGDPVRVAAYLVGATVIAFGCLVLLLRELTADAE